MAPADRDESMNPEKVDRLVDTSEAGASVCAFGSTSTCHSAPLMWFRYDWSMSSKGPCSGWKLGLKHSSIEVIEPLIGRPSGKHLFLEDTPSRMAQCFPAKLEQVLKG